MNKSVAPILFLLLTGCANFSPARKMTAPAAVFVSPELAGSKIEGTINTTKIGVFALDHNLYTNSQDMWRLNMGVAVSQRMQADLQQTTGKSVPIFPGTPRLAEVGYTFVPSVRNLSYSQRGLFFPNSMSMELSLDVYSHSGEKVYSGHTSVSRNGNFKLAGSSASVMGIPIGGDVTTNPDDQAPATAMVNRAVDHLVNQAIESGSLH